jgi:hypothetical protein
MHNVSLDVVRKALANKFISLCTLIYFRLLYVYFIVSIQTGVPYSMRGSPAPLYNVFSVSCLSPHDILAGLVNCELVQYIYQSRNLWCLLRLNLLSIIIPKYFILFTCSKRLLFRNTLLSFPSFRVLLDINMVLDFP